MIVFSNLLDERSHLKEFFIGRISLPFRKPEKSLRYVNAKVILHGA